MLPQRPHVTPFLNHMHPHGPKRAIDKDAPPSIMVRLDKDTILPPKLMDIMSTPSPHINKHHPSKPYYFASYFFPSSFLIYTLPLHSPDNNDDDLRVSKALKNISHAFPII